jgi:hypothetical protein
VGDDFEDLQRIVTMTSYPAVRKTAHHAPVLAELEFAMHRLATPGARLNPRANAARR